MKRILFYSLFTSLVLAGCGNRPKEPAETVPLDSLPDAALDPNTCEWGKAESRSDFDNDSLMLIQLGKPAPANVTYRELLRSEYGIYQKSDAGCVATDGIICYNEFMQAKIEEKYGAGFLDKVYAKADSLYQIEQKKK